MTAGSAHTAGDTRPPGLAEAAGAGAGVDAVARDGIVTVRLFAAARAAAGGTASVDLPRPEHATVADVLAALTERHPAVRGVLPACSFLLDGVATTASAPVDDTATLDVLPPFSGG